MPATLENRRQHDVLMAATRAFIAGADPVGSRTLVADYGFDLSPATVRAVMADLEVLGYLHSPHTSAGRVPTEKAFRYYVDAVGQTAVAHPEQAERIDRALEQTGGMEDLLRRASWLLSELSSCMAFAVPPRRLSLAFSRLSFVRIRPRLILAVLVSVTGVTDTRLIRSFEDVPQEALDRMSDYLNDRFRGVALSEMRDILKKDLEAGTTTLDRPMRTALALGRSLLEEGEDIDLYVEGTSHILDMPESYTDVAWVRGLFDAFEERKALQALLDGAIGAGGVRVYLGSEAGIENLRGVGMVVSPYEDGVEPLGALGVAGPVRMDYEQVIPLVRTAAEVVSRRFARNQP